MAELQEKARSDKVGQRQPKYMVDPQGSLRKGANRARAEPRGSSCADPRQIALYSREFRRRLLNTEEEKDGGVLANARMIGRSE